MAASRVSRRRKAIVSGQKYSLGLRVTGEVMLLLEEDAEITGRTQSEQATHCIYWYAEHVKQMGGSRALSFWQSLAQRVQSQFPGESWLDIYDDYMAAMAIVREELAQRTPPLKIAIQEQIDAGYRFAAMLAATPAKFARRRAHLQDMLEVMSRSPGYPEAVREDFARAAAMTEPPPEIDQAASPPAPAFIHPFWASWSIARTLVMGSSTGPETEADLRAIAEHFEQRADLAFLAGMPTRPTAKQVLEYRGLLLEHGLGPPSAHIDEASNAAAEPPSPPPRPAKRRRSTRRAVPGGQ